MTTDGGGWTLVARAIGTSRDHINIAAVGSLVSPTQTTVAKYSDVVINSFASATRYRGQTEF